MKTAPPFGGAKNILHIIFIFNPALSDRYAGLSFINYCIFVSCHGIKLRIKYIYNKIIISYLIDFFDFL